LSWKGLGVVSLAISTLCAPLWAAVVPWLTLEELTASAEVIVLGTVEETQAAWTPDRTLIVTRVTVAVERPVKGGPRSRVTFEVPGGRVGEAMLVASGAPMFVKGERVVLFLDRARGPGEEAGAARARPLGVAGWNLGKMTVRRDAATGRDLVRGRSGGAVYVGRDGRPVRETGGEGPVELSGFLRRVEGLLKAPGAGGVR
jgi:hypothetical protein